MENNVSRIIASAYGRDKVIDIRDNLFKVPEESYAELYRGGISLYLCDFTKGKGDKSMTVHAQLDPDKFEEFKEVSLKNQGLLVLPVTGENTEGMFYVTAIKRVIMAARSFLETMEAEGINRESLKKAIEKANMEIKNPVVSKPLYQDFSFDYSYRQERVNSYKDLGGGFSPVSVMEINRTGYRDGKKVSYPWFIRITNFEARRQEDNGAVSYDYSSMRNKLQAYINLSDQDMQRLSSAAISFTDTFVLANALENVRSSYDKRRNGGKAA